MIGINYELFDIYIYIYIHTHTHSNSTLKNFIWTKSLKLIKQPCDSPSYINWSFSLPVNFLSSPITFFFFFFFSGIYMILQLINIDFTVGLSHTFTILYRLKFFFAGQLLSSPITLFFFFCFFVLFFCFFFFFCFLFFCFLFFFFLWDIYGFTIGLSHTFTILYQLMFFSAGQLLIFTNNFFFFSGIYTVFLCGPPSPSPSFFFC